MRDRFGLSSSSTLKPIIGLLLMTFLVILLLFLWVFTQKHFVELGKVPGSEAQYLAWSPRGDQIAVTTTSWYGFSSAVYLLDLETGKSRSLLGTDEGAITAIGWSPDGTQILLRSEQGFQDRDAGIWIVDVAGSDTPRYLSPGESAIWSSAADEIAILDAKKDILPWRLTFRVHNLTTDTERILLRARGITRPGLSLSPEGDRIAFSFVPEWKANEPEMPNDIFLLDTGTKQLKRLTISGSADFPAWSPAGRLLAYITQGVGPEEDDTLNLHDVDGGCGYPLLQRDEIVHFAWAPDGRHLAFITEGSRIFQMDLAEELQGRWQDGLLICD